MQAQAGGGPTQVQQQTAQLRSIKRAWKLYGRRLSNWWSHIGEEDRLKFLLVCLQSLATRVLAVNVCHLLDGVSCAIHERSERLPEVVPLVPAYL